MRRTDFHQAGSHLLQLPGFLDKGGCIVLGTGPHAGSQRVERGKLLGDLVVQFARYVPALLLLRINETARKFSPLRCGLAQLLGKRVEVLTDAIEFGQPE